MFTELSFFRVKVTQWPVMVIHAFSSGHNWPEKVIGQKWSLRKELCSISIASLSLTLTDLTWQRGPFGVPGLMQPYMSLKSIHLLNMRWKKGCFSTKWKKRFQISYIQYDLLTHTNQIYKMTPENTTSFTEQKLLSQWEQEVN